MKKTVLIIIILFLASNSYAKDLKLTINCTIHSKYEEFFVSLLGDILKQHNIKMVHNTPPVGRSLINVNNGIDDGDGPRIEGLDSVYKNIIIVDEPFGNFYFGAFSKDKNIEINGWSSLKDYNVGYVVGWKIYEKNLPKIKTVTRVKSSRLLFLMLEKERIDLALLSKNSGNSLIAGMKLKDIFFIDPPLEAKANYLYLNKKHKELSLKIAKTLKQYKKNGKYKKIYNSIMK